MPAFIDLSGQNFGLITVISIAPKKGKHIMWLCRCECGKQTVAYSTHLVQGNTKSCGCQIGRTIIHGMTGTTEYKSWQKMKERCLVPSCPSFKDYGDRGITICERWLNSFENFYADMGKKPEGYSIERINNEKGYYLENCKWATRAEQNSNTRRNIYITHNGETMMIRDWSRRLGGDDWLVGSRLKAGWDEIRAVTTPIHNNGVK